MLLALLVAVLAVALGAALTALSGARPTVIGLLRTFAATAAAGVVLTHLLPEAVSGVGLWGALAFLLGLVAPLLLHPLTERLASRRSGLSPQRLALEAGFFGLLVHHIGDGLGIGAYAALAGGVLEHLDVIVALIAHTVPLVAVVTLAYRAEYGIRAALWRAGALAGASALGVLVSFAVPERALASASAWIGALVGGVLLHVVTHDWLEDLPSSEGARIADLLAAALGLSLVLLGGHEHQQGAKHGAIELMQVAIGVALQGAPFLVIGLALSFALGDKVHRELDKLGSSLPVVLGRKLGFAFGAEGILLGVGTYGIAWSLAAFAGTTLAPLVAGAVATLAIAIAGEDAAQSTARRLAALPRTTLDRFTRFDRVTAIWVIAVALASVLAHALPDGALFASLGKPSELITSSLVATLLGSGGPIVVMLGALAPKGLSPGAGLVAALLSSALGARALRELWRMLGRRGFVPILIWLTCLTGALGIGINQVAPVASPLHVPAPVQQGAAVLLGSLIALRIERVGIRRWLAGWFVGEAHADGHHGHGHHGAAPAHSNEIPNGNAATTRSPEASGPSAEA